MDKCTYFIQLLIVLGGLVFIDGQHLLSGYGRRGFIRPRSRFYPRYPVDPYESVLTDPYARRRIYPSRGIIRDSYFDDATIVRPVVVDSDLIGGRRPTVITDSSGRSNQDTNVVNHNNNEQINRNSNNVVVSQSTGRQPCTNSCEGRPYSCIYPEECLPDESCTGRRCRIRVGGAGLLGGGHLFGGHVRGGLDDGHFIH